VIGPGGQEMWKSYWDTEPHKFRKRKAVFLNLAFSRQHCSVETVDRPELAWPHHPNEHAFLYYLYYSPISLRNSVVTFPGS
jgi:hypothetical protein